jgi:hypothetical protein
MTIRSADSQSSRRALSCADLSKMLEADIEITLTIGVHGPDKVIVFLVA